MKKSILLVLLVLLSFTVFVGCAYQEGNSEVSTINVNGTGKIITDPDTVEIRVSVVTDGKDKDVQQENALKAQKVIDELLNLGLEKKEIETENVNFSPVRKWTEKEGEVITGYRAENTIVVKTTKTEKAGQISDTAVNNGAQFVGNLVFSLSDEGKEKLLDKAIEAAVNDAKKQAEAAANAAGVKIDGIKTINVIKSSGGAPIYFAKEQLQDARLETPIMPKDAEYLVTVDVSFILK
ncbi:MAG: hypothetical protein JM58_16020 [Peptococcaceae bacterium BICA1-8]|nr:MAG: hypothetical protein JM58_16020 [Peptococcaceae bacterium BICA1-8]